MKHPVILVVAFQALLSAGQIAHTIAADNPPPAPPVVPQVQAGASTDAAKQLVAIIDRMQRGQPALEYMFSDMNSLLKDIPPAVIAWGTEQQKVNAELQKQNADLQKENADLVAEMKSKAQAPTPGAAQSVLPPPGADAGPHSEPVEK
jgi:hypothetical protein